MRKSSPAFPAFVSLALGLSLIFGMMDVLNLAHGALFLLGAEDIEGFAAVDDPVTRRAPVLARAADAVDRHHVVHVQPDPDQPVGARAVEPVVSVQNRFSLADRSSQDVLDVCERDGLGFRDILPSGTRG